MTKSYKMTFAAVAAVTAVLGFAVVPAMTNLVFAQDCPGCQGGGHRDVDTNRGGHEKEEGSRAAKCEIIYAGQSDNPKGTIGDKCKQR
jgi:hypothetical protein